MVDEGDNGEHWVFASGAKELWKCMGCEDLTLRAWQEHPNGDEYLYEHFYPPRVSRRLPPWLEDLTDIDIRGLLGEIYAALHADHRRLAMMGCRAVLDRVLVRSVGDEGGFKLRIASMVEKQLLSRPDAETLSAAVDAGSASAHRGHLPTAETLDQVVSIVEHMVQARLLAAVAKDVRRKTPKRRKTKRRV